MSQGKLQSLLGSSGGPTGTAPGSSPQPMGGNFGQPQMPTPQQGSTANMGGGMDSMFSSLLGGNAATAAAGSLLNKVPQSMGFSGQQPQSQNNFNVVSGGNFSGGQQPEGPRPWETAQPQQQMRPPVAPRPQARPQPRPQQRPQQPQQPSLNYLMQNGLQRNFTKPVAKTAVKGMGALGAGANAWSQKQAGGFNTGYGNEQDYGYDSYDECYGGENGVDYGNDYGYNDQGFGGDEYASYDGYGDDYGDGNWGSDFNDGSSDYNWGDAWGSDDSSSSFDWGSDNSFDWGGGDDYSFDWGGGDFDFGGGDWGW